MENNAENMTLVSFCGLSCVVLVVDVPLTLLDFVIMQGGVLHMITLYVHVTYLCLSSSISKHTVLNHTSSNHARAKKVCRRSH